MSSPELERMAAKLKPAKHTPGPWSVSTSGRAVHGAEGSHVADTRSESEPYEIDEANAHLIAAAPELLAALKTAYAALAMIDDFGTATGGASPDVQNSAIDQACAAIAKAEGGV